MTYELPCEPHLDPPDCGDADVEYQDELEYEEDDV